MLSHLDIKWYVTCNMRELNDRLLVRVGIDARNDHQKVPGFDNGRTEE